MIIRNAIELVDHIKPNAFNNEAKVFWLNQLEGKIFTDVMMMNPTEFVPYVWPTCRNWTLLVDPPYDDIYTLWLQSQIDMANGEYTKYENTMQIYNAHYNDFIHWFIGMYDPVQGYPVEGRINNQYEWRDGRAFIR